MVNVSWHLIVLYKTINILDRTTLARFDADKHILLTKHKGHTGRILAQGLDSMDRTMRE